MDRQIIQTKLNIPRLQSNHFSRERLLQKMDDSSNGNLVLVSAPAGYGKTTLVSEWTSRNLDKCAWYSLNNEDNNVITFIYYLIESFKAIDENIGKQVLCEIEVLDSIGIENLFISLINDFIKYNHEITLVLDDYHLISNEEIHKGVNFILEHLPDNTRVIVITRDQECIPTTKFRAKNRLLEITLADLVFDIDEISIFLNEYLHEKLSMKDIAFIQEKTEGWITSLHLFAMSLLRQENPNQFIESFSGKNEYVFDYLLEEVFKQQPIKVRKFLMITALFNRFNSSLAATMLEVSEEEARETFNQIKKANLFIVRLDNEKIWYRYHHLFQEFLQKKFFDIRLKESLVLEIYDFASVWFYEQGFIEEAINNAIIAKKYEYASILIEKEWMRMDQQVEASIWLEWVKQLPESIKENRPVLNIEYAWALMDTAQILESEPYIEKATVLFEKYKKDPDEVMVYDETVFQMLESMIYSAMSYLYITKGDEHQSLKYALMARDRTKLRHTYEKRTMQSVLALSLWCMGRIDEALQVLEQNITNNYLKIQNSIGVGRMRLHQGKLQLSHEHFKNMIDVVYNEQGVCNKVVASYLHDLALIDIYQGKFDQAKEHLEKSANAAKGFNVQTWDYYYYKIQSLLLKSEFKYDQSIKLLNKAQDHFFPSPFRDPETIDALKTLIYIEEGKTSLVLEYITRFDEEVPSKIEFLEEQNYVTLVKALLYKYKYQKTEKALQDAETILHILQKQFTRNHRTTKMVDAKILETLIHLLHNRRQSASDTLQEAIELAEVEDYVLPFIEAGTHIKTLLTDATLEWCHKEFVLQIIKQINQSFKKQEEVLHPPNIEQLITPLSKREIEVLELISQGFTNEEISKTLYLAISTVKNYNQSLFGKLGVKNRTEAIKKASSIGII